jgi:hypothetical protein
MVPPSRQATHFSCTIWTGVFFKVTGGGQGLAVAVSFVFFDMITSESNKKASRRLISPPDLPWGCGNAPASPGCSNAG